MRIENTISVISIIARSRNHLYVYREYAHLLAVMSSSVESPLYV